MEYIKYFENDIDYQSYKERLDFLLPNVSYAEDIDIVYFNPLIEILENGYSYAINVASDDTLLSLFNYDIMDISQINEIKINDEAIIPVSESIFSMGNYTIDIKLNDRLTTLYGMFSGCTELTSIDLTDLNTTKVTDMSEMFIGCSGLTSLDLSGLNTSNVTNMSRMFASCQSLTSLDSIKDWDTSNVTYMRGMFYACQSLTSLDSIKDWDTSNVTNMYGMFNSCEKLTSLDSISNWDTSNVIDMCGMFNECTGLTSLDNISNWDTSNVINMSSMFEGCSGLTSIDGISNWDTSNVTYMDWMFSYCSGLTSLDLSNWDTSRVASMEYMFYYCSNLSEIKMGGDVSKVTNVNGMFYNVASAGTFYYNPVYDYSKIIAELPSGWTATPLYENITCTELSIVGEDVSGRATATTITYTATMTGNSVSDDSVITWTENGTFISSEFSQNDGDADRQVEVSFTFYDKTAVTTITQGTWNKELAFGVYNVTSNSSSTKLISSGLTVINTSEMYIDDAQVIPISEYTFSTTGNHNMCVRLKANVTDVSEMFSYCPNLYSIDLSNWDTSEITNMSDMFYVCTGLTSIGGLSNWDTSNVTDMSRLFGNCLVLNSIDSINNWNTSNVTDMSGMFIACWELTSLDSISNWNTSKVTDMSDMFFKCSGLTSLDSISNWNTSKVKNMNSMFEGCFKLTSIDGISNWNTSKVKDMGYMFSGCTQLTSLDSISNWDTSKVTDMGGMFRGCYGLTSIDGISNWDTSKVTNMYSMFNTCYSLTSIDSISNWDTHRVTSMSAIFAYCSNLSSIDLTKWDTHRVTNMEHMFYYCSNLSEIKMGGDVSNVIYNNYMFTGVASAGTFYYNPQYDYSKIIAKLPSGWTATRMAENIVCTELSISAEDVSGRKTSTTITYTATMTGTSTIDGSVITWTETGTSISSEFTQNTSETDSREVEISFTYFGKTATTTIRQGTWNEGYALFTYNATTNSSPTKLIDSNDLSKISEMYIDGAQINPVSAYTFSIIGNHNIDMSLKEGVTNMNEMFRYCQSLTSVNLSNWDTSNVTDMYGIFIGCSGLTSLDLSNLNTSNVTDMRHMFDTCYGLTSIDLSGWDTSNVTTMDYMFYNCTGLTSLDLSNLDTSNVTDMSCMFSYCKSLTSLDLSNLDTSNVTNMGFMFRGCSGLTSLDLSNWDTSNVTNMNQMFYCCSGLTSLDLSNWDTSKVTNMSEMFSGCTNLISLDSIKDWDVSNVTTMDYMFRGCSKLTSLDSIKDWDVSNVTDMGRMFSSCTRLTSLDSIKDWDVSNVTDMGSMFDECSGLTSLDLSNWDISNVTDMSHMFNGCLSLSEIKMGGNPCNVTNVNYMFYFLGINDIASAGTFYYNPQYDYSKIIAKLPPSWTVRVIAENITCTELSIIGEDVSGKDTATTITYTATMTGNSVSDGSVITWTETGTSISSSFTQNDGDADRQVEVSFTYYGKTATTTITQSGVVKGLGLVVYSATSTSYSTQLLNSGSLYNISEMYIDDVQVTPVSSYTFPTTGIHNVNIKLKDNVTDLYSMFSNCNKLISLDLSSWDVSNVTKMSYMFDWCSNLTSVDLSNWDVSNVTDMGFMFRWCENLSEIKIGGDVSKVTHVTSMFYSVASTGTFYYNPAYDYSNIIAQLPSGWNTVPMAENIVCTELSITGKDVSGRATSTTITYTATMTGNSISNGSVVTWNETGNGTSSLFTQNTSETDSREVEISFTYEGLTATTTITQGTWNDNVGIGIYNVVNDNVTTRLINNGISNILEMYVDDNAITPTSSYNFETTGLHNIHMVLKNGITDMNGMFSYCDNLTSIDLSNWDTSNVTNMSNMFNGCSRLTSIGLSNWDTSEVTNMGYMFSYCSNLHEIRMDGNVSNVTNVSKMFNEVASEGTFYYNPVYDYSKITAQLPSGWVTNPMAENIVCTELSIVGEDVSGRATATTITYTATMTGNSISDDSVVTWTEIRTVTSSSFEQNTSETDSRQVEISFTYKGMTATTTITQGTWNEGLGLFTYNITDNTENSQLFDFELDTILEMHIDDVQVSPVLEYKFSTNGIHNVYLKLKDNVTNLASAMSYNENLISVNLSNWNTNNVTNISWMFEGCHNLTSIDLSGWNTSNVIDMSYAFYECYELSEIKMGGDVSNVEEMYDMFYNVASEGTFHYNSTYDYSNIIAELPSGWIAIPLCENISCTELSIVGEDVSGKATVTTITYTATMTGNSISDGSVVTWNETRTVTSSEFTQNTSETNSRQVEVSFTYYGKTATTTITQGTWNKGFINCTYDITDTGYVQLMNWDWSINDISEMYVNGMKVTPVIEYDFSSAGIYNIDMKLKDNITDMSSMFYYCNSLTSIDLSDCNTSNVTNMAWMFEECYNLSEIRMGGNINNVTDVSGMFSSVASEGTFYYNPVYDYSNIIAELPSDWTIIPLYENVSCTGLSIVGEDVSGRATATTITYTATMTGNSSNDGSVVTWTETGNGTSSSFTQNTSETNSRQVEVSFTYYGKTATTTITQGVWVNAGYEIDLNNQWQLSTTISNPDSSTYEGVYESFSNIDVDDSAAIMYIDIVGYETFSLYVRSYAESNYDYVVVSNLDCTLTYNTTSGSNVKMTTSGKQNSGTAIGNYTLVEFTNIDGGEHRISIMYRKDVSSSDGTDQGYLLIPKNQ